MRKRGFLDHSGYPMTYLPEHPGARKDGHVLVHRLVVQKQIGYMPDIRTTEIHHIDGNRKNNSPSNLAVLAKAEHRRIHAGWELSDGKWLKPCSGCGRLLPADSDHFYRRRNGHSEFMGKCKKCQRREAKASYWITPSRHHLSHAVTCPVCGTTKWATHINQIYCSVKCAWVVRRKAHLRASPM